MADTATGWDIAGTIADSVAALGTLGALIWAIFLYRRQVQDARTDQASKVFITLMKRYPEDSCYSQALIDNSSDLPIFDVFAAIMPDDGRAKPLEVRRLERLQARERRIIEDIDRKDVVAEVLFRDAATHRWHRDASGHLHPVHDHLTLFRRRRFIARLQFWRNMPDLES
jgi:hypothetical protein